MDDLVEEDSASVADNESAELNRGRSENISPQLDWESAVQILPDRTPPLESRERRVELLNTSVPGISTKRL